MWTSKNRPRYGRGEPRYPSNGEWQPIEPLIPAAQQQLLDRPE